jgi:hypothetical protein
MRTTLLACALLLAACARAHLVPPPGTSQEQFWRDDYECKLETGAPFHAVMHSPKLQLRGYTWTR